MRARIGLIVVVILSWNGSMPSGAPEARQQSAVAAPDAAGSHEAVAGVWMLRDRGTPSGADAGRGTEGRGRAAGRRGMGGGILGGPGRGGQGNGEQMKAVMGYVNRLMEAPKTITMVIHETSVAIAEAGGGTLTLQTDNREVDERAENGLVSVSRRSQWAGGALVSEIEIDNGPTIERRYELSPGGSELHVSTRTVGGRGGGNRAVTHIYERPLQ